jgi:hypothetical protein
LIESADEFSAAHHCDPFAASFWAERAMRARAVMYAALFTAAVEALAIYGTQQTESGRALAAQTAHAAPAPAVARAALAVAAPSIAPAYVRAATQLTRAALDTPKPITAAATAMASATQTLNNTRPKYEPVVHHDRKVHRTARRYRVVLQGEMIRLYQLR